jgi:hypothetical protein
MLEGFQPLCSAAPSGAQGPPQGSLKGAAVGYWRTYYCAPGPSRGFAQPDEVQRGWAGVVPSRHPMVCLRAAAAIDTRIFLWLISS